MNHYSPPSQQPAGLADVLNPKSQSEKRDSAYFSSNGDASKHTSVDNTVQYSRPTSTATPSSGYNSNIDKTPSPRDIVHQGSLMISPPSNSTMSVASMVSPTAPSLVDASMKAKLDGNASDTSHRASLVSQNSDTLSRRESVDSRHITGGVQGLNLQSSPYASHNQSTTSIQASLHRERNPGNGPVIPRIPSNHGNTFGIVDTQQKRSRIAPAITGPADSDIAHGDLPTHGQAWAFPASADHRIAPSSGRSNDSDSRQTSFLDSRRSSIADSITSSQYTTDLPPGQRRFEDSYGMEYPNHLSRSSDFQGPSHHHHHHHHSLQHKQVGDLRDEDGGSPSSQQPYSRTPELRISHKLAERKRRNEMKELYDELRALMPQDRGNKASKWEILSKAIAEHRRQAEEIERLSERLRKEVQDHRVLHEQYESVLRDRDMMYAATSMRPAVPVMGHMGHVNQPPSSMDNYPNPGFPRGRTDHPPALPPIRNIGNHEPVASAMSGVQYDSYRPAGYPTRT